MLIYLDSVIVIYIIEGLSAWKTRAERRLSDLRSAGDRIAISDLTWLECRVKPLRLGDNSLMADYQLFLGAVDVTRIALPAPVFERATEIRARHKFKLGDSLHLAAAIEGKCDSFLTNDRRLAAFPDLSVEVLP